MGLKMKLEDFDTIEDAKAHTEIRGDFISANSMNSLLAQKNLTRAMKIISETDGHPAQNAMLSFFDPRSTDYNFIIGDPTGDAQIALLDGLIDAGGALNTQVGGQVISVALKFAELRPILIAKCNVPFKPFENVSNADFARAKGNMIYKQVDTDNLGWVSIETNADVEEHRPQVFALSGGRKKITTFGVVSKAGIYDAQVERQYTTVYVEDYYQVIK